jgi:hypothetical protein
MVNFPLSRLHFGKIQNCQFHAIVNNDFFPADPSVFFIM